MPSPARHALQRPATDGLRRDIQGLRALAVLLVVANHLLGRPAGGYVGVDVFFVISGFLLTGLLLREQERSGRTSLREFYARRVRRILPVAALVLVVTNVVARSVFAAARVHQTLDDSVWALLFGANVHFSSIGTDYFQQHRPPSPVQHYWSLSVEEQFYVLWPALLIVGYLVARRMAVRPSRVVLALAGTGTAASFAWALHLTASDRVAAYFSTPARAWELGIGALCAVLSGRAVGLPEAVRAAAAWTGLGAVAAATALYGAQTAFPGLAAMLPVLGTALVLAAQDPRGGPGRVGLLDNPVAGYLGKISYSLYLWHFPCLVLADGYFASHGVGYYVAGGVLPLLLSMWSFHLVEDPIRHSRWLSARSPSAPHRERSAATHRERRLRVLKPVLAAVATVLLACTSLLPGHTRVQAAAATPVVAGNPLPSFGPATRALQAGIAAAIAARTWPTLSPALDVVSNGPEAPPDVLACTSIGAIAHPCSWGDPAATHTAILVGDSTAMAYTVPLRAVFQSMPGWRLTSYALYSCIFTGLTIHSANSPANRACPGHKQATVDAIHATHPDLVIVTNSYLSKALLATGDITPQGFVRGTENFLAGFAGSVKHIVFLAPPPYQRDISFCFKPGALPSACLSHQSEKWRGWAEADQELARGVHGTWVDTRVLFCDALGQCPSFVGSTIVKMDKIHLAPAYQAVLGPALKEVLARYHLFGPA